MSATMIDTAVQLLSDRLGLELDSATIGNALTQLLGGNGGELDLAGLAAKMAGSGELGGIVNSWLGDGGNAGISADSIKGLFGDGEMDAFASRLGTDTDTAASGLADVLPQLMDRASSGGSLLDSLGGAGGLLGAAKSFLS